MRRGTLWLIYGLVLAGSGLAIYVLYAQEQSESPHQYWHIATLVGSLIIAIGWIVASGNTVRNAQRQHAITISLAYEYDAKSAERRKTIRRYLATGRTQLIPSQGSDPPIPPYSEVAHELYEAVDYELNFMDFIANGVLSETLDNTLIRNGMQSQFFYRYYQAKPYVQAVRRQNRRIWSSFVEICDEWGFDAYTPPTDGS